MNLEDRVRELERRVRHLVCEALCTDLAWNPEEAEHFLGVFEACEASRDLGELEVRLRAEQKITDDQIVRAVRVVWKHGRCVWACRDYASRNRCALFEGLGLYDPTP